MVVFTLTLYLPKGPSLVYRVTLQIEVSRKVRRWMKKNIRRCSRTYNKSRLKTLQERRHSGRSIENSDSYMGTFYPRSNYPAHGCK